MAEFGGERIAFWTLYHLVQAPYCTTVLHCAMPAGRSPSRVVADPLPTDDLAITHKREHKDRAAQDQKFIAAMIAAMRAGTERPHRIGINTAPGTRAPMMINRRDDPRLDI
jgi:hypothetical protein